MIADRVPQTGGSPRAMIQNGLLGSALYAAGNANPWAAATVIPAMSAGEWALGSPAMLRAVMGRSQSPLLGSPALQLGLSGANRLPIAMGLGVLPRTTLEDE